MVGKWLVVLPLLVDFSKVTLQPITAEDDTIRTRPLAPRDCCPCPDAKEAGPRSRAHDDFPPVSCPCRSRADDAEGSASILMPALRAMQPLFTQPDQKTESKPLLQPEVGLASSVLETLRQATDEEYHEALARDAAKSAVKFIESTLDPLNDALTETPKNKLRIFLNPQGDDMDDNLPEPSHIQETRCIHAPLQSIHKIEQLRNRSPSPVIEVIELPRQPKRKPKNKSIIHRNFRDMDNGIGASNIQERIIQPDRDNNLEVNNLEDLKLNPTSFGIFKQNNLGTLEDLNLLGKNVKNGFDFNKKNKPNLHLKLRELLDDLEMKSKKEKSKIPNIDFKKYISTTTRIPTLAKLNPIEKSTYNNRPLLLKNLLKLKDVELIPRNSLTQNTGQSYFPNLKLQSDLNSDIDNCKGDEINLMTVINKNDITTTINPMYLDKSDIETSPTNSKPIFESMGNEVNINTKQNSLPDECLANLEHITDVISTTSIPTDVKNKYNFDYGDENKSDYCNVPTGNSASQSNINTQNEEWNNKDSQEEQDMKSESNEDIIDGSSDTETFQIDLIDDLDTPIIFDDDSFNSESNLEMNGNIQNSFMSNKNTLEDPAAQPSNNNLQIENQDINKNVDDCNSPESFLESSRYISENTNSEKKVSDQEIIQLVSSEDNVDSNSARDGSSNIKEDTSVVTFKDLQAMSNSILSLSDCLPPRDINQAVTRPIIETNSNQIAESSDIEANSKVKDQPNKKSDINFNEKLCEISPSNESPFNANEVDTEININSEKDCSEMRAEASVTESKLHNPKNLLHPSVADSDKNVLNFPKVSPGINDILKVDKNKKNLEDIKFKLAGLFSTTEKKITSDAEKSLDDNGSESSNMNPTVAKLDVFQKSRTMQRMPNTLGKSSPLKLPLLSLNNIPLPNHVTQPETSNLPNFLFPFNEDALDPRLSFTALSDRLRGHTENTIKNVKETLESTLKDSQGFRFSNPSDTIDTHGIIESISNRHDDMREKLEAIHLDFNDRLSSFQQSVLDHFNVQQGEISDPQKYSNGGVLRANYKPLKNEITPSRASKFQNNFVSQPINIPKERKNTEITLSSPKLPISSEAARSRTSKGKSSLPKPVLYSTTTAIPSFIPRSKVLKTYVDSIPKLTSETGSKSKPYKASILSDEKVRKIKPLLLKPGRISHLSEEPSPSPSPSKSPRINLPIKSLKTNNFNEDDSPVNKFKKTLSELNQNRKDKNELNINHQDLEIHNLLDNKGHSSTNKESSRSKIGRLRIGSRNNDELIVSPTSHMNTLHHSRDEAGLRLVEPLQENVPYKCKLICYKDS